MRHLVINMLVFLLLPLQVLWAAPMPHLDSDAPAYLVNFGISPDGRYLVFTQQFPPAHGIATPVYHLQLFDFHALQLRTIRKDVNGSNRILFETDDRFAFEDGEGGVTLMSAATGEVLHRFSGGFNHALCNGRRLVGAGTGVELYSFNHELLRYFSGKGFFNTAVCSTERALVIFNSEAQLYRLPDWTPVCAIPALHGSTTAYRGGALLGDGRVALLDHWSGVKLFDNCTQTRQVTGGTQVMARQQGSLLIGYSGPMQGLRNSVPAPLPVGIRRFDLTGRFQDVIAVPQRLNQLELHPKQPDILVTLADEGPFRFIHQNTGRTLTLEIRHHTNHWLLFDNSGAYHLASGSEPYLYFTEGTGISPQRPAPFKGNLYRAFLEQRQ